MVRLFKRQGKFNTLSKDNRKQLASSLQQNIQEVKYLFSYDLNKDFQ